MPANWKLIHALLVLAVVVTACSLGQPAASEPASQPTVPPAAEVAPPTVEAPLYERVTFTSESASESSDAPKYTLTSETPSLQGVDDGRVVEFNVVMQLAVKAMVDGFKDSMKDMPVTPIMAGSSFDVRHELLSPPGYVYSVRFNVMGFTDGAAHPYHFSRTITFDLETGMEVTLNELFLPDSQYLQAISDFCRAELSTRDIGFTDEIFASGANPTPENYKSWNITPAGLLITFDEYQVAPYAAGPQEVTVPYGVLKDFIDPQGPLGRFIQ